MDIRIEIKKTFHKSGELETEKSYLNGLQHGIQKHFHKDGSLRSQNNFSNGFLDGIQRTWWYGNTEVVWYCKNGNYHGLFQRWWQKGNRMEIKKYNMHREYGPKIIFNYK